MNPDEVARRFDNRPGFRLISFGEVGLPVYRVQCIALTLAKKKLGPIPEFILRSIDAGVDTTSELSGFLGLSPRVTEASLTELIRSEDVAVVSREGERIVLTAKGRETMNQAQAVFPSEQTLFFTYDGLTRNPKWYGESVLFSPREIREAGIPEIRSFPARGPELGEVDVTDVTNYLRLALGKESSDRGILRIKSIERRQKLYKEAVALVYRSPSSEDLQVGFALDGRISEEHELAFARAKGVEKTNLFKNLGVEEDQEQVVELLGDDLANSVSKAEADPALRERLVAARSEVANVQRSIAESDQSNSEGRAAHALEEASAKLAEIEAKIASGLVRPLAVYDHPSLLVEALEESRDRVLIISPWIRRRVVSRDFVRSLRSLLGRGVKVWLGYGLGDDQGARRQDIEARRDLEELASENANFVLRRLGDTHAKVLVKDSDFFVITSFNWLSFRGDANRTFREEWGTLVGVPELVEQFFSQISGRFSEGE